jgi:hypothetical protein
MVFGEDLPAAEYTPADSQLDHEAPTWLASNTPEPISEAGEVALSDAAQHHQRSALLTQLFGPDSPDPNETDEDPDDDVDTSPVFSTPLWDHAKETLDRVHATSLDSSSPILRTIEPVRLPRVVRSLLHHYINHVVDLMTAVATPKGPWKSISLPRALLGVGQLVSLGRTSHACNALYNAILAISAYNLAALHNLGHQEAEAQIWREGALKCRARAVTLLKTCLDKDCCISTRGKYKEVVAAMLSMITIDVSWRDGRLHETLTNISRCVLAKHALPNGISKG